VRFGDRAGERFDKFPAPADERAPRDAVHTQVVGRFGERLAEEHLVGLGGTLLERNYRIQYGEIDLLFEHDGDLVAVEVKTRDVTDLEDPLEAVHFGQLRRIVHTLTTYAQDNDLLERSMRIDVVAVRLEPDGSLHSMDHLRSVYPG
jgi:putative endonuclease